LGWLAGVFQRNHLIDFVAQYLPELINNSWQDSFLWVSLP
jgi:hypothetical protein